MVSGLDMGHKYIVFLEKLKDNISYVETIGEQRGQTSNLEVTKRSQS